MYRMGAFDSVQGDRLFDLVRGDGLFDLVRGDGLLAERNRDVLRFWLCLQASSFLFKKTPSVFLFQSSPVSCSFDGNFLCAI